MGQLYQKSFRHYCKRNYLQHVSVLRDLKKGKAKKLYPPYGLTFASFTADVGVVDVKEKRRKIDAGHVNGYLIMPGIVYHLSASLEKGNIHEYIGKSKEMKLIQFICRYGYATRKALTFMLHVAYTNYCQEINETNFFQGCVGSELFLSHYFLPHCSTHAWHIKKTKRLTSSSQP